MITEIETQLTKALFASFNMGIYGAMEKDSGIVPGSELEFDLIKSFDKATDEALLEKAKLMTMIGSIMG